MSEIEVKVLGSLVKMIRDIRIGLDPDLLAKWYDVIVSEAKSLCPQDDLRDSIEVIRDPVLTMRFEVKASRRAVPYIIEAIENNLSLMPFATRLYFQKLEEIILDEASKFGATKGSAG